MCEHRKESSQNRLRQQVAIPFRETDQEIGTEVDKVGTIVVPLIVKGDVAGSVEAVVEVIRSRNPENFELKIIQSSVGAISESDIEMAATSKG